MAGHINDTAFAVLLIILLSARIVAERFWMKFPRQSTARLGALLVFLGMCAYRVSADSVDVQQDSWEVLVTVVRSAVVAMTFCYAIAMPSMVVVDRIVLRLSRRWHEIQRDQLKVQQGDPAIETKPPELTAEPLPREVTVRREAEQAKADYDFECQLISTAGLDDDEEEAARNLSKQKYLNRLRRSLHGDP